MVLQKTIVYTALLVLLLGVSAAAETGGKDAAEKQSLKQLRQQYSQALNSQNVDQALSFYTEDAVLMAPFQPPIEGRNEIGAQMRETFEQYQQNMTIESQELEVAGEWAYDRGTLRFEMKPHAGGETTTVDGNYVAVLKRDHDGSWKLSRVIYNYQSPPPGTAQAE
jgi:uncharacterized protein (TIGR02246 family)